MQNPADTFPDKVWLNQSWIKENIINKNGKRRPVHKGFDSTVRNVIRIAKASGFSKVVILNIFSLIQANGKKACDECKPSGKAEIRNKDFVCDYLRNHTKDLMIAWGFNNKLSKEDYLTSISEKTNLWAYAWNKNKNCPYHPSQQVDNIKKLRKVRNFIKNPVLIPLKIIDGKLCINNQNN